MAKKIIFIDRDGTLIKEPHDFQVDCLSKIALLEGVIPALLKLQAAGFTFVMVSNQDGLGTERFPHEDFQVPHEFVIELFASQGIQFEAIRVCPHLPEDACACRKPKIGLVMDYLIEQQIDHKNSYMIGDRETDILFGNTLGVRALLLAQGAHTWGSITQEILSSERKACVKRKTNETNIIVDVNLDDASTICVRTGIGFFDHMLEQLGKHGGFGLKVETQGDLHIDDHHTVEDTAIVLGEALNQALQDKRGIERYGFVLPMDEALAQVAIDLSGRPFFVFSGHFPRAKVGKLSTELVPHFFHSFAQSLRATLHIDVKGENTHHMVEAMFKGVGRVLRLAFLKTSTTLPTTKGVL